MFNPVSHIIYSAYGSDVRDVIIAGKIVVRNRKLLFFDLETVIQQVASLGRTIGES